MSQQEELIDAAELARRLKVTKRYVLRMAREGKIPSLKLANGRSVRFEWRVVRLSMGRKL
jgi:excisionase family DNA binding protein